MYHQRVFRGFQNISFTVYLVVLGPSYHGVFIMSFFLVIWDRFCSPYHNYPQPQPFLKTQKWKTQYIYLTLGKKFISVCPFWSFPRLRWSADCRALRHFHFHIPARTCMKWLWDLVGNRRDASGRLYVFLSPSSQWMQLKRNMYIDLAVIRASMMMWRLCFPCGDNGTC